MKNITYYLNRQLRHAIDTIGYCSHSIEFYERAMKSCYRDDQKPAIPYYQEKIADSERVKLDMEEDVQILTKLIASFNE